MAGESAMIVACAMQAVALREHPRANGCTSIVVFKKQQVLLGHQPRVNYYCRNRSPLNARFSCTRYRFYLCIISSHISSQQNFHARELDQHVRCQHAEHRRVQEQCVQGSRDRPRCVPQGLMRKKFHDHVGTLISNDGRVTQIWPTWR